MNDEIRREIRALVHEELNDTTSPSNGSNQRTISPLTQQRQEDLNFGQSPAQNLLNRTNQGTSLPLTQQRRENLNFGQLPVQNLLNRTRSLIRNSVTSLHELNNFNSRSTPHHPDRNTSKKRKLPVRKTTYEVIMLKQEIDSVQDYTFNENDVVVKLLVNINSEMSEVSIRNAIANSAKSRLPLIQSKDFDFVKRDRHKIILPCVDANFRFDFNQVKCLAGQGKLYVKLNVPEEIVNNPNSDSDDNLPAAPYKVNEVGEASPSYVSGIKDQRPGPSEASPACTSEIENQRPGPSNNHRFQFKEKLKEIFPDVEDDKIEEAITINKDISDATIWLLSGTCEDSDKEFSLTNIFNILGEKIKKWRKNTITVDDVVSDTFCYYKGKSFDPKIGLKVIFSNQPGIDAGGLSRQLYTSFFNRLSDTSFPGYLFEGGITNLLPICRTDTCLSEIFYHIGVIMAHSLCQGIRPLRLCEAAYHYLINGRIEDALPYVDVSAVGTAAIRHFVGEVCNFVVSSLCTDTKNFKAFQTPKHQG